LDLNTFNHIPPNVRRFRTWTELAADPKASPPDCPGTRSPYGLAAQTITLAQILPTTTVTQWKWPNKYDSRSRIDKEPQDYNRKLARSRRNSPYGPFEKSPLKMT